MADADLLAKNFAVFERHFPQLHARLKAVNGTVSQIIYDRGEPADIDFGSARLYGSDGRISAVQQAQAYVRAPSQVGYCLPDPEKLDSLLSRRMHHALMSSIEASDVGPLPEVPAANTGYLFILGVGLGHHLPVLLEQIRVPHIVICEVFEEFLLASMQAIDWGKLVAVCEERGCSLHVICENAADSLTRRAIDVVEHHGPVYLDGSHFYQHYGSWVLQETRRRLINELPRQMISRGYFEDERKMVRNVISNLHKTDYRILNGGFRQRKPIPVFVVAAGPSVDEAMPYIKQWRDHALVFSAGSGLQPCLENGIIPDFHVEVENTYWIFDKLIHISQRHPDLFPNLTLEGIHFIASATVTPGLKRMFDSRLFFFRDSSTSSLCFGSEFGYVTGGAPTVANGCLATIARMGLGDVYLFGVDCGWRSQEIHHSRDTIYYTADMFLNDRMDGTYTLPGNFGGTVESDIIFDWCRNMLEQAIAAFHMTVYNCSDGALFGGATPMVPEALHFDGAPLDRKAVIDDLLRTCPKYAPGEFFANRTLSGFQEQLDAYERALVPLVDTALAEDWPFHKFHDRAWAEFGGEASDRGLGMAAWVQYSTVSLFKHSSILLNRIADDAKRQTVTREFYRKFKAIHEQMFVEIRTMLHEADAWFAGGPEPEWTDGVPKFVGTSY